MKEIKEKIFVEEIKTLMSGGQIRFYNDANLTIHISGQDFKECERFKHALSVLNMTEKRFNQMLNILDRYDNEEYWEDTE